MRTKLLPLAVAVISLFAGVVLFQLLQPASPVGATKAIELHSIPLQALDGEQSVLADWRGNILVVNLWAPWCAPCRREIPTLIDLHREYADRGVRVLGLALDGEQPVRQFAAEQQMNYPLFLAGVRSAMYNAALGNLSGSLPFTVILDRNLNIVFQHNGEVSAAMLRESLATLGAS